VILRAIGSLALPAEGGIPMHTSSSPLLTVTAVIAALAPVLAQTKAGAPTPAAADSAQTNPDEPAPGTLVVGSLQLASDANLAVEGANVSVAVDNVAYTYQLRNNGQTGLNLFASIAMPVLAASPDGSETWALPSSNPENPVSLIVAADGAPIATKVDTRASALGVDRLGEIRAAHLPLVPFGPEIDKAVAALTPEAVDKLAALGILSPRDPKRPSATVVADWNLPLSTQKPFSLLLHPLVSRHMRAPRNLPDTPPARKLTRAREEGEIEAIDERRRLASLIRDSRDFLSRLR
jgi:hypothetical protein